jgi:TIR domain
MPIFWPVGPTWAVETALSRLQWGRLESGCAANNPPGNFATGSLGPKLTADNNQDRRYDFFISYTQSDRRWAEWIAWHLEEAGHRVLVQAWDFVAGSNWQAGMQIGVSRSDRTIALLSPAYLRSVYGQQEWQAAQAADPLGFARKLIPIRIADCIRPGLLSGIVSFDLFDLTADDARRRLRAEIHTALAGRAKPLISPHFPGHVMATPPSFPGPMDRSHGSQESTTAPQPGSTPAVSADGQFRWDGTTWVPMLGTATRPYARARGSHRREPTSWTQPMQLITAVYLVAYLVIYIWPGSGYATDSVLVVTGVVWTTPVVVGSLLRWLWAFWAVLIQLLFICLGIVSVVGDVVHHLGLAAFAWHTGPPIAIVAVDLMILGGYPLLIWFVVAIKRFRLSPWATRRIRSDQDA